MSVSVHPVGTPPATDTSTPMTAGKQSALLTKLNNPVGDPVNDATRDPKFGPGAGQAFFSTGLGARAPRSLGDNCPPVIARSVQDPAVVAQAASYWQVKYKSQCLCILPSQGWTVEDLWDAEDIHVEDRKFCEEVLTFISRSTYYWVDRFARDWARAHPDRVDFTGLEMGNVYNTNDSLDIIDKIFIFGEPIDFPRVFLWHVAYILVGTWIEMNKAMDATLRTSLIPQAHAGEQKIASGETKPSSVLPNMSDRKKTKSSSAVEKLHLATTMASGAPDPPDTRLLPQRIPSQGPIPPGSHSGLMRGGNAGIVMGSPRVSPNLYVPPLVVPKTNRNMGSGTCGQPNGWIENNNRTTYGAYPRQPSVTVPSMQSPSFLSPQMAMGQQIPHPMIPGLPPYVQMAPIGYGFQQPDLGVMSRAHINYQQGMMQNQPMNPAFPHHPNGQNISVGDMTNNMYHTNSMMYQYQDPHAPMPRRASQRNAQDLFDPYSGNNPKFNGAPGYNSGPRKGGNNSFVPQPGRGRKVSNMGGRDAYSRSNADLSAKGPPGGPRNLDFNARRRLSEDDPTITGDSVSGCGHTWIGPKNLTVNELWIGDLPPDAREDEIIQLFKQTVDVTATAISLRSRLPQNGTHAFATFASCAEAKMALGITKLNPYLRGGRLTVTVPRRFFQKDTPSTSGYFDQSLTGKVTDHTNRDVTRTMTQQEEKTIGDADPDPTTANGKALYSPQDARSGLSKPPTETAITDRPEMESIKSDVFRRQQKSPTKRNKGKGKRESPVKIISSVEKITKTSEKMNTDDPTIIEEEKVSTKFINTIIEPTKPEYIDVSTLGQDLSVPVTAASLAVDQPVDAARELTLQLAEESKASDIEHDNEDFPTEPKSDISLSPMRMQSKISETTFDTVPTAEICKTTSVGMFNTLSKELSSRVADDSLSEDEAKNDNSFHSAPEVQPESVQVEPQPRIEDKAITAKQVISESPLVAAEADVRERKSALDSAATSTTTEVSPTDVSKKAGAPQIQSLHPFAKNKSQAKKEREAKKKQQKKEDADRIAKAKAEKAAFLKKPNEGLTVQSDTGSLEDFTKSSMTRDAVTELGVAHPSPNGDTTTANKKPKKKAKATASEAGSTDRENKARNEEETGKLDSTIKDSKEIPSITLKAEKAKKYNVDPVNQESLDRSGAVWVAEPTSSRASPAHLMTTKARTSTKNMPAEVNDPQKLTYNQPTHITGPRVPQEDSNLGLALPSSGPNDHFHSQHSTPFQEHTSRSSSPSTLVGDEDEMSPFVHPMPAPKVPELAQLASVSAEAPHPDTSMTTAPKKKKKKSKNNKNTASTMPNPTQPHISGNTRGSAGLDEDYHTYDPFASQLSHIDAIRRAVNYDTSSYFARTNARIEKEAEERKEAGRSPKASRF
ncbi:hypothetical protein AG0111_0g8361 [Alternaria gaisen]|uniref:Uncharacterized protein n=1 Tax=Alternaria gaisen TaxID=167740 RepID=A0ACB6FFZ7_9PLEO|nr:hypothetical protein AG0111_0g8361 [Alternaria gaisen]